MGLTQVLGGGLLKQGVIMEQHKEPALSRDIKRVGGGVTAIKGFTPCASLDEVSPEQVIAAAKAAKIIDERDGMPLYKKLKKRRRGEAVILVDAIDDEPYVSSQMGPMLYYREQCISGLRLAQKAMDSQLCSVLIYKNITELETRLPTSVCGVPVKRIGGVYPAEIRSDSSIAEAEGQYHIYIGACALIHLHRAVFEGRMHATSFVTVTGNCIGSPRNLEMDNGSTVQDALDACGLIDDPTRVIVGGSITGRSIADTSSEKISPVTRAVLAFRENERQTFFVCIGCGRCIRSCPMGLNPMLICRLLDAGCEDQIAHLDADRCIGCMTCSYVCPAKLDIADRLSAFRSKGGPENDI